MIAKRYGLMTVGAFLMAFSVVVYFNPLELVTGGVTGLAILLEHLFHIPLWLVNAAVNIPLFIIGYKVLGKLIFYRTVYATVCLSVFLGLIRPLPLLTGDVLVDGLCGGVIMGGGLGLIFLQNASSGGADMTAQIINRRIPHVSVPKLMAIVDGIIILFGIGVFGLRNGIYALIVLFVMTRSLIWCWRDQTMQNLCILFRMKKKPLRNTLPDNWDGALRGFRHRVDIPAARSRCCSVHLVQKKW